MDDIRLGYSHLKQFPWKCLAQSVCRAYYAQNCYILRILVFKQFKRGKMLSDANIQSDTISCIDFSDFGKID